MQIKKNAGILALWVWQKFRQAKLNIHLKLEEKCNILNGNKTKKANGNNWRADYRVTELRLLFCGKLKVDFPKDSHSIIIGVHK